MVARLKNIAVTGAFSSILLLNGCIIAPDSVKSRGVEINTNLAEYSNEAMLYNVVRAGYGEPLLLLPITQVQGHNTLSASLTPPTINLGSHQTQIQKLDPISATSSRSFGNDFTMNVTDDQATNSALFSPITPSSVALLIDQGYSREFVFKLLVDRVRIGVPRKDGAGNAVKDAAGKATYDWTTLRNDPAYYNTPDPGLKFSFNLAIEELVADGLTVQYYQPAGIYSASATSNFRICFSGEDTSGMGNALTEKFTKLLASAPDGANLATAQAVSQTAQQNTDGKNTFPHLFGDPADTCDAQEWFNAKANTGASQSSAEPQAVATVVVSDAGLPGRRSKKSSKAKVVSAEAPAPEGPAPASDTKAPQPSGYVVTLPNHDVAEIHFRSIYGTYRFLGSFVEGGTRGGAEAEPLLIDATPRNPNVADEGRDKLFLLEHRPKVTRIPTNSFTYVVYYGDLYYVPQNSNNTKAAFAVLHQLVQLYLPASNAQGSVSTVRPAG